MNNRLFVLAIPLYSSNRLTSGDWNLFVPSPESVRDCGEAICGLTRVNVEETVGIGPLKSVLLSNQPESP